MRQKFVVWFKEVGKEDIPLVGGKGANLGEMTQAGFPVPPGFIITAAAYAHFIDVNGLRGKIADMLHALDVGNSRSLDEAAEKVQWLIIGSKMPAEIAKEAMSAYFKLGSFLKHPLVAVRSSATAEDLPNASFAGQQATFLNVRGEANMLEKIKEAWASLFTARAIFYRKTNNFDHFKVAIAVPVQKMVESESSGVLFTVDPLTNDKKKIVIEAVFGLGEVIVQGAETPDHYETDKATQKIILKQVHEQKRMLIYLKGKNIMRPVSKKLGNRQKITDNQILELAKLGKKLENHYYFPQDAEWAIEKEKIYLVQTRPVTTLHPKERRLGQTLNNQRIHSDAAVVLKGDPASPGISSGPVKIIHSAKELHTIAPGDVLVAEMTNPDFVPAMRKAVAIVTARGGRTSHAAIVSRELGIPAVVGASNALSILKNGKVVTVNGSTGEVFEGAIPYARPTRNVATEKYHSQLKTATKVYVNLAEPDKAVFVSKQNVDGVGLLRAEFMIAAMGRHPRKFIEERKQKVFVSTLSAQIETICRAFYPRPVVYRATDFRTNEYRNLIGGKSYEPEEPNPMLGFRGAARYIADPAVFEMELETIKNVRNKMEQKNLWLMIPFVRTPHELLEVKKIIAGAGLLRSPSFKLWLMVEVPTNVIRLEDFIGVGIDGVSIGSNDLTMLLLGTDRDNSEVAHDFSELDPSVLWAFERTIKICQKHKITSSICGQAPSDYPELVEKLVSWGITSVSINADAIERTRLSVSEAEKHLVKGRQQ